MPPVSLTGASMALPTVENLPPEVDDAVRGTIASEFSGRAISHIRVADSSPHAFVLRVFLPVPLLKPSPYVIYSVDLPSLAVTRLSGGESKPYWIANYK